MRSRILITALLTVGALMATGGVALALSDGTNASVEQYGKGHDDKDGKGDDKDCFENPKNHNSKDHTKGDKNHNSKDHITRGDKHTKNQNSKDHTKGDKNHNSKDHIIRGDDDCDGGGDNGGGGGGGGAAGPAAPAPAVVPAVIPPTVVAPAPVANVTEPAPEQEPPADVVQEPRQLDESELPFTGFAAVPLMLFGFAMLAGGLALRRSMRGRAPGGLV